MISMKIKTFTIRSVDLVLNILNDFLIRSMEIGIIFYLILNGLNNIKSKYGIGLIIYLLGVAIILEITLKIYVKVRIYLFERYRLENFGIVSNSKYVDSIYSKFRKLLVMYFLAIGECYTLLILYPI